MQLNDNFETFKSKENVYLYTIQFFLKRRQKYKKEVTVYICYCINEHYVKNIYIVIDYT